MSTLPANISVKLMQPADMARWDAFVADCPDATFFHRAGWKAVIERAFGHPIWISMAKQRNWKQKNF